jgi:SSS family solute:Na+ symporter
MQAALGAIDWVVVLAYLGLVALIAWAVTGRQKSTRDYFLGGRSLPWWAAALSIIATETSALTYIGVPRKAYQGDWAFLQLVIGFAAGRIFLALFFVRVFYKHEVTTVYGFLKDRYGALTQKVTALLFLLGRVVGSAVRLYAGCLALQVATGLPLDWTIALLGAFGTIYTIAGGIRAVVWTDVLLGLTFVAGGLVTVVYLVQSLPDGLHGLLSSPLLAEKTRIFIPEWGLKNPESLLAGLAGGFVLTLATHGTDQDVVQRMLTCRDSRSGSFSVLGSAFMIIPLMALFLLVGTLLFFFYASRSVAAYPLPENPDHLFPVFIVRELPRGFSGLVMAGLLAASLSSFTSVLNALASTVESDFYRPFRQWLGRPSLRKQSLGGLPPERHFLRFSKAVTLFWGLALILLALAFQGSKNNVLDVGLSVLTYFYGALLGTFLLGIFTTRGSSASVVTGMIASVPAVLLLQFRAFVEKPELAPDSIRSLVLSLPESWARGILAHVPSIAWPWWIVIGTAVTCALGLCGSRPRRAASGGGLLGDGA